MAVSIYPPSFKNFSQAAGLMREMIRNDARNPEVRKAALALVKRVPEMWGMSEAAALHKFVRDEIRYTDDPFGEDLYQLAGLTLEQRFGDCDDKVLLLGAMARSIGFGVRLVFVFERPYMPSALPSSEFPIHVYLELDVNKGLGLPRWIAAETIPVPDGKGAYRYFELGECYPYGYSEMVEV